MTSVTTMTYDAELHTKPWILMMKTQMCIDVLDKITHNLLEMFKSPQIQRILTSEIFFIQSMHILVKLQCE